MVDVWKPQTGSLPSADLQASPFTKIGAWVLPYIVCLKRISPLSFIPPVPYPLLRDTFP